MDAANQSQGHIPMFLSRRKTRNLKICHVSNFDTSKVATGVASNRVAITNSPLDDIKKYFEMRCPEPVQSESYVLFATTMNIFVSQA